ncbi:YpeB-like protein with putative protease inhibitory function [Thioclava sp. ES.031]|uniref:PepSY domain-containing protein n=1 Tax=unclassified Thioclava TaxID=2621713 RepID=UPI000C006941|nr:MULTISPECIES: PepSY domain-containing protein [unclassified Thioclava]PFG63294.1 YpeB-like protein with putative protease inhibitory function [Thioclava sp. ES.031]
MKYLMLIAASATIAAASTLPALAEGGEGAVAPAKEQKLAAELKNQGYDVRRMEMEDGYIEVYAMKDGKRAQLFFNSKLQQVKRSDSN